MRSLFGEVLCPPLLGGTHITPIHYLYIFQITQHDSVWLEHTELMPLENLHVQNPLGRRQRKSEFEKKKKLYIYIAHGNLWRPCIYSMSKTGTHKWPSTFLLRSNENNITENSASFHSSFLPLLRLYMCFLFLTWCYVFLFSIGALFLQDLSLIWLCPLLRCRMTWRQSVKRAS